MTFLNSRALVNNKIGWQIKKTRHNPDCQHSQRPCRRSTAGERKIGRDLKKDGGWILCMRPDTHTLHHLFGFISFGSLPLAHFVPATSAYLPFCEHPSTFPATGSLHLLSLYLKCSSLNSYTGPSFNSFMSLLKCHLINVRKEFSRWKLSPKS